MKGKIVLVPLVLVPFPFTDLTAAKLRPALVLFEGDRDLVVAFISSRIPEMPPPGSVVVSDEHREFELTGLKSSPSLDWIRWPLCSRSWWWER